MILDNILRKIKGEKIVILGQNNSGKTTLNIFLREKRLIKRYEVTTDLQNLDATIYKKDRTKIYLKKGIDINGDRIYSKYWQSLIKENEYCLFLFDTSKILKGDKEAIDYLTEYLPYVADLAKQHSKKLLLIGNFTDKIHNFDKNRKEIKDKLRPLLINAIDEANINFCSILFGNLSSKENIFELIDLIYKQLKK